MHFWQNFKEILCSLIIFIYICNRSLWQIRRANHCDRAHLLTAKAQPSKVDACRRGKRNNPSAAQNKNGKCYSSVLITVLNYQTQTKTAKHWINNHRRYHQSGNLTWRLLHPDATESLRRKHQQRAEGNASKPKEHSKRLTLMTKKHVKVKSKLK